MPTTVLIARAMTLVDVLAALAIIAATVTTFAPLAVDARSSSERSLAAIRLRAVLSTVAPPMEPTGERPDAALPNGCQLRWHSVPLTVATGSGTPASTGRLLTMQVVRGLGPGEQIEAERTVPLLVEVQ